MKKVVSLIVVSLFLVASCTSDQESEQTQDRIYSVKTEVIQKTAVPQILEFTGNIEPMFRNNISSAAAQRIEKIYVEVGSVVKKGDLLVEMESVNYAQAKIQLENLKLDLSRIEALYNAGGVSAQQYDQILAQVKISEQSIANLQQNTKLMSPINGVVTHRNFDNGDLAVGQPILVVMQMQPVKILINISEEFFPQVKVGTPVDISLDIYPDKQFSGRVALIHPTIDPSSRTFQAEVRIDNRGMVIRPGMFARARVDFGSREKVVVSDRAVIKQMGTNDRYVYVVEGNTVSYTKITLGRRVGSIYEVKEGLQPGQVVVVAGQTPLVDGSKIEISESTLDLTL